MALVTAAFPFIFQRLFPAKSASYEARSASHSATIQQNSSFATKSSGIAVFQYVILRIILLIPVIIYYATIYTNAFNFPYEDDLNSALAFISDYAFNGLGAWDKLKLIFSQYNEHRIVFDRLIFLADYGLFGQLNFRHLILIGNLAPLLIAYLFLKVVFRTLPLQQRLLYLIPVAYSLFSFQYWELSTWSMAALQNLYVIPFAMFSLYSLCKSNRTAFAWACVAAVAATYTSGNGLFTFIAGAGILLLLKSYQKLAVWVLIAAVSIGLYFLNYIRPPYHPDIVDSLVNHTGRAIAYFFTLIGSQIGPGRQKLALLFGLFSLLVTLGLVGYLVYQKKLIQHLPLLGWIAFLYLTCLSLMASRSGMGVEQAFTPRYGIVAVMVFATQAVLAIETITQRYFRLGVAGIYILISIFFYVSANNQGNRRRIEDRTRQMRYNSALYQENPKNVSLHWGNQEIAGSLFNDAIKKGFYQVPKLTFSDLQSKTYPFDLAKLVTSTNITSDVKPYNSGDFLVIYRAWAQLNNETPRNLTVQLIARSATAAYGVDTYKHTWDDRGDYTLGRQYTQPGFSCVLNKKSLKPGRYQLWLYVTSGDQTACQPLAITLDT
ncbi:hypothetical protein GCM10028805_05510 [Spirosoma harenae]